MTGAIGRWARAGEVRKGAAGQSVSETVSRDEEDVGLVLTMHRENVGRIESASGRNADGEVRGKRFGARADGLGHDDLALGRGEEEVVACKHRVSLGFKV